MLRRLRSLWRAVRRREAFESQMADEMRFHLESRVADLEANGLTPAQAQRQARLEFGNPAAIEDRCRDARRINLLDDLVADVRFAIRGFNQNRLLSAVIVLTLTFGIGISSGVFTIFSRIALQPPVGTDPGSFLQVYAASTTERTKVPTLGALSVEEYVAFRDGVRAVRALSAFSEIRAHIGVDAAAAATLQLVTCNHFEVYGLERPARGRLLQPADCETAAPVLVLSHTGWLTRFGADEGVIGRTVSVAGVPVTIVGIAPPSDASLKFGAGWLPYTLRGRMQIGPDPRLMAGGHHGHDRWLMVSGRLAPEATRAQAAAEMAVIAARNDLAHPGRTSSVVVTNGATVNEPRIRATVLAVIGMTMAALSCLVLIACANVATLLLSRAEARQKEVAVRISLGAGRGRVMRMLLTETLTLAAVAGAASVYVAYQLPRLIIDWLAGTVLETRMTPDWRAFAYLAATVCLAGVAAGLAPAFETMRVDVLDSLKGRRSLFGSRSGSRFRSALVAVQVGLSFVLVVGSALFLATHYQTRNWQTGFETGRVLMPRVTYRTAGGVSRPSPAELSGVLRAVPGTGAVVFAQTAPVFGSARADIVAPDGSVRTVSANEVSPGFFTALDLPILRGRALDEGDRPCEHDDCQIVISESFARRILNTQDPVGQAVRTRSGVTWRIVGVARDTATEEAGRPDGPQAYLPWIPDGRPYQALVRVSGDPSTCAPAVAAALRARFPGAFVDSYTLRWPIDSWIEEIGKVEALVVGLSGAAVALAAIGIFGVVSFAIARRRQELGVRLALGAGRREIHATVIRSTFTPVAIGLIGGLALAVPAGLVMGGSILKLRVGAAAANPLIYAAAALVLLAIIGLALAIPARRAAAIDPLTALRSE